MSKTELFYIFIGIALIGGGGYVAYEKTRGIRNNNPGNIRKSSTAWQGKIEGDDPSFETFDTMPHGIRALGKILLTYYHKYNLQTVRDIINRWAPPNENDTGSYVNDVAARVGVNPDQSINVPAVLYPLTKAIIHHENGVAAILVSSADIQAGVDMALS